MDTGYRAKGRRKQNTSTLCKLVELVELILAKHTNLNLIRLFHIDCLNFGQHHKIHIWFGFTAGINLDCLHSKYHLHVSTQFLISEILEI